MHKTSLNFKKHLLWTEHHGNLPALGLEQIAQGRDVLAFWPLCPSPLLILCQEFSPDEQYWFVSLSSSLSAVNFLSLRLELALTPLHLDHCLCPEFHTSVNVSLVLLLGHGCVFFIFSFIYFDKEMTRCFN